MFHEITFGIWLRNGEEAVVKADLSFDRVRGADPMDRAFHFAARGRPARLAIKISSAAELGDAAAGVFDHLIAFDDVSVFEARFPAGPQPEKLWRRIFQKIIALYVKLPTERHLPLSRVRIFWVVDGIK